MTAEELAAATERAQSFLKDPQFIEADRNIARCFQAQAQRIAELEAERTKPDADGQTPNDYEELGRSFFEAYNDLVREPWLADFVCCDSPVEILSHLLHKIEDAQLAARGSDRAFIDAAEEVVTRAMVAYPFLSAMDQTRKLADGLLAAVRTYEVAAHDVVQSSPSSGALATAQAVTLTEADRKFVLSVAAFLRGQDFDEWPDKLIALFDRITGASTP